MKNVRILLQKLNHLVLQPAVYSLTNMLLLAKTIHKVSSVLFYGGLEAKLCSQTNQTKYFGRNEKNTSKSF